MAKFGAPGYGGDGVKDSELNVGDEINVVVRGRIIEKGAEIVVVDLLELFQQNRVPNPVYIPIERASIRSKALPNPEEFNEQHLEGGVEPQRDETALSTAASLSMDDGSANGANDPGDKPNDGVQP
jgi:hypothetical protein